MTKSNHVTGNIALYYVCWNLSKLGWKVIPTKRHLTGPNIVECWKGTDRNQGITVQVRSSKTNSAASIEPDRDNIKGDFWIIITFLNSDKQQTYILSRDEVKARASQDGNGKDWLEPEDYEVEEFKEKWDRIETRL